MDSFSAILHLNHKQPWQQVPRFVIAVCAHSCFCRVSHQTPTSDIKITQQSNKKGKLGLQVNILYLILMYNKEKLSLLSI